jgi:serine/threonine protein kinase
MIVAGKYELLRKLGTGAMGEVWAARHKSLDEEVAIKLVMSGVDHEDGTSADSRFLLEARVAAALSRKTRHIVAVTDHGQDNGLGYLVMELLAGESLDARVARTGALPVKRVAPMITQIARGLSMAHAEGVVHRDLKPSNVFVTRDEEGTAIAKILDFGIAKLRRGTDRKAAHATQRGFLLGTPAYMSPEQARGKAIDHRADVWALSVIAYHMLTNAFPFDGETGEELFARICRIEPTPIHELRPDLPPIIGDFFARAFAVRIEDRFQSALALAGAFEQLEPLAAGSKLSLPPPSTLGVDDAPPYRRSSVPPLPDESLFVAGVPQRKKLGSRIALGVLLVGVLATTGAMLKIYFEREPNRAPTGMSAGATVVDPNAAARMVPPPEPPAEKAATRIFTPDDLPTTGAPGQRPQRTASGPNAALPEPAPVAPAAPRPPEAMSIRAVTPAPVPPPAPTAPRNVDKSEVF